MLDEKSNRIVITVSTTLSSAGCTVLGNNGEGSGEFTLGGGDCSSSRRPVGCTISYTDDEGDVSGGTLSGIVTGSGSLGSGTLGPTAIPSAAFVALSGTTSGTITLEFCEGDDGSGTGSAQIDISVEDAAGNPSNTASGTISVT